MATTETKTLKNGNNMEVTSIIGTLSVETINSGFENEFFKFRFSGRTIINKPTKVGTIKITPGTGNALTKPNFQKSTTGVNSTVKLNLIDTTVNSTTRNVESYLYDVIYTAKENVKEFDGLGFKLENSSFTIPESPSVINSITYGKDAIDINGENKKIIVRGTPGVVVDFSITKLLDSVDSNGNIVNSQHVAFGNFGDLSVELADGSKTGGKSVTIPSTGFVSFNVRFPRVSSKTRYSLNVNDYTTKFSTNFKNQVEAKTGGFNVSDLGSTIASKILTQNVHPTLTLRATTGESAGNVNLSVNGGAVQTFNSGANVDKTYKGKFNSSDGTFNNRDGTFFKVKYVMTALSGAFSAKSGSGGAVSFTNSLGETESTENTFGAPVWSNEDQSLSDWTNSNFKKNGGTNISITRIDQAVSTVSSSNDTLTLQFKVYITSWGTQDVTMALKFDNLITRS
jgi:hypothetical protein